LDIEDLVDLDGAERYFEKSLDRHARARQGLASLGKVPWKRFMKRVQLNAKEELARSPGSAATVWPNPEMDAQMTSSVHGITTTHSAFIRERGSKRPVASNHDGQRSSL